jgi:hypothetical protein
LQFIAIIITPLTGLSHREGIELIRMVLAIHACRNPKQEYGLARHIFRSNELKPDFYG